MSNYDVFPWFDGHVTLGLGWCWVTANDDFSLPSSHDADCAQGIVMTAYTKECRDIIIYVYLHIGIKL